MNEKNARFVAEYLVDLNATQAAIRAGYSKKTAGQIGFELLKKPEIEEAVRRGFADRAKRVEISQDYVVGAIVETVERCKSPSEFNPGGVLRGAELIGKHLGMFKERVAVEGADGGPLRVIMERDDGSA